jgi:hypothetical protein
MAGASPAMTAFVVPETPDWAYMLRRVVRFREPAKLIACRANPAAPEM